MTNRSSGRCTSNPPATRAPLESLEFSTPHCTPPGSASLWAAVPSYVPSAPSPKAALALLERLSGILQVEVDTQELSNAVPEYERQIGTLVSEDEETTAYVAHLVHP